MVKMDNERKRLIITLLLTAFFLGFLLFNVAYEAGFKFLVINIISLIIIIFWNRLPKAKPSRKMFSFQKDWILDFVIGIIIGIVIFIGLQTIPGFSIAAPSAPASTAFPEPLATAGQQLTVVVAAPLVEEIAFRTVLFAILFIVIGMSFFWSTLVSSAVFSLYHIKVYAGELALNQITAVSAAFVSAFLIAVLLCYINKWRGSVTTGIGAHGAINGGLVAQSFVVV